MDPVAAAAMILLSCSPDMASCHPGEARPVVYRDMAQCSAALPDRLRGNGMIGRCRPIDAATARSGANGNQLATVRVTRGTGANAVSTDYLVLHAPD
ncbi:hypothetical protein EN858_11625 [Mesorhizobium sp. M4B.F.Ca.ET.215.01.1.1]|nr:hypothetical protein EOA34_34355 [Mesorhizobium sp. M4B.F.Ca.ET.013.02.1.1]RUW64284.1 hypothetical protein EOA31_36135 [Mesorhizobium sp. M4B.F.Ca.ET.049.02.1.2]RVC58481.1 hypothetical protein EN779_18905 [Mesorhizobium sp. M4B.F.Ca.ET.088.02.2.1]RVD28237.1 hypothetical protein EN738_10770 [Mesorhizobium sp. M4B.F.Ca.ET.017.02.2.1]RVD40188.1 hypothetical protein EN741_17265 [Mesorhizobium sp. M4B.F.Ca.ET.019.03.1.1]RWA61068.1 MAG: hypothetical protein EOQ27_21220 [Mesorhizobium sp.]RWX5958